MKAYLTVVCVVLLLKGCVAPPPRHKEKEIHKEEKEKTGDSGLEELGIEYERYLKEVIDVLENDPEFKRKLEAAEETDIRTGKIAHELEYVDHNVRSKLDEIKRTELERLRHLAQREYELTNGIDVDHMKIRSIDHLDHNNPHTFEIDDLKKLIAKVTNDLNEADKKRREEFKEYEMQKEFENNEKLKHLEGAEKESFEKQLKDNETKHKQHDPLHHPGSKQQLEEVWEKQDHMQQEFNPKVFFQLHDIDGNGYWDQTEVKALFLKELDKMYQAGAPEDDMRERAEELERMREHVFREADKNGDQLISFQEFMEQTKQPEFEKDPAWETVDQQPAYTHEEYMEFERRRQQEIQHMIQQGLIPPQPMYGHAPSGYHQPQHQQFPQGQHPQQFQQQQHPGQYPTYQQAHHDTQQGHPNQFQQQPGSQQGHPNQFQQHPGSQQGHPNQFQQHPGSQQGHPNQFQQHPGSQQGHPNQYQPQHDSQQVHAGQFQHQQAQPGQFQQQHLGDPGLAHPSAPQVRYNQNAHPQDYQTQPPAFQSGGNTQNFQPGGIVNQHHTSDSNAIPQGNFNAHPQANQAEVHSNDIPQQHPNQVPQHPNLAPNVNHNSQPSMGNQQQSNDHLNNLPQAQGNVHPSVINAAPVGNVPLQQAHIKTNLDQRGPNSIGDGGVKNSQEKNRPLH